MKVYICGDSTAAGYSSELTPLTGWGQVLQELLPGLAIENHAIAGRSTRTFLAEGRLKAIESTLAPGDLVLIQFAHNDEGDKPERHTEPWQDFRANLYTFIDAVLKNGARPVLLTPICIRVWRDGALQPSHGEYLEVIRSLSKERNVLLIDVYAESFAVVRGLGEEGSRKLYMHLKPNEYPGWPDGKEDDTHTCFEGASRFAKAIARGLKGLGLI